MSDFRAHSVLEQTSGEIARHRVDQFGVDQTGVVNGRADARMGGLGIGDENGGGIGTLPRTGSSTVTEEEVRLDTNDGDHDRFSHYVRKEKIVESAVTGKAVKALCGKKWVPSRDPEKFPICPTCKEIYSKLPKE